MMMLANRSML